MKNRPGEFITKGRLAGFSLSDRLLKRKRFSKTKQFRFSVSLGISWQQHKCCAASYAPVQRCVRVSKPLHGFGVAIVHFGEEHSGLRVRLHEQRFRLPQKWGHWYSRLWVAHTFFNRGYELIHIGQVR
ncbi:MAG TPA: hypothetical protein VF773_12000 [Verrucomicrobiae bacterium]